MIGIVGGGLAGLSLASFLKGGCEVLEKNPECGGLCRSLEEGGYTLDYGGAHILFSRDEQALETLLKFVPDRVKTRRDSKIYFNGKHVKYPFENGLSDLPEKDNRECLDTFINNDFRGEVRNLKDWVYATFGRGIAEKYLIPYNEKIWNCPAEELSASWVDGRIPKPPAEDIIKSSKGVATEGYTHQLYYYYPKEGGIQTLIRGIEKDVESVRKGFEVIRIKKEEKWVVSNGREEKEYGELVSTMPLFELAEAMELPGEVSKAISELRYNSLITILLGVDGEQGNNYTAVYIPDTGFLPHRITFPKTMSPQNAPDGHYSVMAEITFNEGDDISKMGDGKLIRHASEGLDERKFLDKSKIAFSKVVRTKYAYVLNDLKYDENTTLIRDYFSGIGLHLCGRFSEYKYLNMDHIIQGSQKLAGVLNG